MSGSPSARCTRCWSHTFCDSVVAVITISGLFQIVERDTNMWNVTLPRPFGSGSPAATVETGVGVLDRTLAIVEAVGSGSRTFSDIAEKTGLARSTAHRLLKALEAHGLVSFEVGFGYRLGPRLIRLASAAMRELSLRDLARAALERLARVTGETAQLFVRGGDERLCIDVVESQSELRTIVPVGAATTHTDAPAGHVTLPRRE